jgi:RimJ/RimL family protein N-acetyltransferase
MAEQPTFQTQRLTLRPFRKSDAPHVQRMAGDRDVARTTLNIPHPYEPGMAEAWIATHAESWVRGTALVCAIVRREDNRLVGATGLTLFLDHRRAELGYWIGREHWGNGYATEAAAELLRYGFAGLSLNRVMARHFAGNDASGRVMQKLGMQQEGVMRQHILKWGQLQDIVLYGILASEHRA